MEGWWQDLRFGARSLFRNPAVTTLGLLTLALGIGANTAIFSVVDGVLLKPLPFPRPDRLVILFESAPKLGVLDFAASPPNFKDWHDQNRSFASLAAMRARRLTLTGHGGEPQALLGAAVTGDFFRTLSVQPLVGRLLAPRDDRPGGERVVVLGADLWQRRFGGDPGIVHRQIVIDGLSYTVVGVSPRTFNFPRPLELWIPLGLDYAKEDRGAHYLYVLGRLKPGVSLARAQAEMSTIAGRLTRQFPGQNTGWGVMLTRLSDLLVKDVRPALLLLQAAVWLVLLIAATNVANLMLGRMIARKRELSVRAALGAGRLRMARQIVAESVILFATGGGLGLLVAFWGTRLLLAQNPDALPRAEEIAIGGRALAYTLLVSVVMGAVFGLVPALSASGGNPYTALREGGPALASGRRARRAKSALVLGEVALALMLLVSAGLLIQSFARLMAVRPGFEPEGAITTRLSLPESRYPDGPRQAAFFEQVVRRVSALPGVRHTAAIHPLPLADGTLVFPFVAEGRPALQSGEEQNANGYLISPDYFRAMKIPHLKGRLFTAQDDSRSPLVVIVNRTTAARVWPGQDPLGQRIAFGKPAKMDKWMQVVGVVGDVRSDELASKPKMEIYFPQSQIPVASAALVVRTAGDPHRLIGPLREAVRQLDANLPLDRVETLEQVVASSVASGRVKTLLLGIFASLALVLAAIGVYGLVNGAVTERVHEIGIRIALGARRDEVIRMVLRQGMQPVALGLAAGLAGAYATRQLLAAQLYEVGAADPFTYIGMLLVLTAVALLANWLPARRATRVDPLEALRSE